MKKILCLLPSLAILAALSGCCANNVCNCNDELADALFFKINYTAHRQRDASGRFSTFNAKDIDTLRIYRTSRRPTTNDTLGYTRTTDSVTVARTLDVNSQGDTIISPTVTTTTTTGTRTLLNQDFIAINNASPFASTSTTKLNGYTYRIGVISAGRGRRKPTAIYYLTNIQLAGRYNANGCCTCYENTGKSYTLTYRLPTGADVVQQINAADTLNTLNTINRAARLPYTRR